MRGCAAVPPDRSYVEPSRSAPSHHRPARGKRRPQPGWAFLIKIGPKKQGRSTPAGLLHLGAGARFGSARFHFLREARLRGLHVLHFGEHGIGGTAEPMRRFFQERGALRKAWLVVHVFVL